MHKQSKEKERENNKNENELLLFSVQYLVLVLVPVPVPVPGTGTGTAYCWYWYVFVLTVSMYSTVLYCTFSLASCVARVFNFHRARVCRSSLVQLGLFRVNRSSPSSRADRRPSRRNILTVTVMTINYLLLEIEMDWTWMDQTRGRHNDGMMIVNVVVLPYSISITYQLPNLKEANGKRFHHIYV